METSLNRDERQSRFELKTLLETSRMLIESREINFILNNILLIIMGKLLVGRGAILLYEPSEKKYHISRIKGRSIVKEGDIVELPEEFLWPRGSSIHESAAEVKPIALFHDGKEGHYFNLRTSSHHLGYLYLGPRADERPFTDQEMEFTESLCIISSVAIANSRMFGEMRKINRKLDQKVYELNTLFDLSKDFSLMTDREKIASSFKFTLLGQMLIRKFFLIYELDSEPVLMGFSGLDPEPDKSEREAIFSFAKGVIIDNNDQFDSIPYLKENGITALVSLHLQGEKTAVVGVGERANSKEFTPTDLHFLQSLGTLAMLSIQKTLFLEERIEKERLEEELTIAQTIQQGFLPDPIPSIPTLDLVAVNVPSYQVGGDYFDVMQTPDGNFLLAIGDVTGKGIPAALLMANLQSMLHILLPVDTSLDDATDRFNDIIWRNTPADKFITFFWGKYYPSEKRLSYVNAGHNPPLILRAGYEEMEELETGGLILGAMPSPIAYEKADVNLQIGDIAVFFTDGVTEAFDSTGREFGDERLAKLILKSRELSAADIQKQIIRNVQEYSGDSLSDDMTLIVFKVVL